MSEVVDFSTYYLVMPEPYTEQTAVTYNSDGTPRSYLYGDHWDFSAMERRGNGKKANVPFTVTETKYRIGIQETLFEIIKRECIRNKDVPTSSQLDRWRSGLQRVASALGSTDWTLLDNESSFKRFKRNVSRLKGSKELKFQTLTALNKLSLYGFCQRHYTVQDVPMQLTKVEQNIAIPIGIYQPLLQAALVEIEKYHPYRNVISAAMKNAYEIQREEYSRMDGGSLTPQRVHRRTLRRCAEFENGIPDFRVRLDGSWLDSLQAYCALVVLAFSGIRKGELQTLTIDSYQEKKKPDGRIIATLQGESTKDEKGRPVIKVWQTHEVVKTALELAHDMTQFLRNMYQLSIEQQFHSGHIADDMKSKHLREIKSVFLTIAPSHVKTSYVNINIAKSIKNKLNIPTLVKATPADVEEFEHLNPTRSGQLKVGGQLPKLTPHDFRRTFAVFFVRYGFGSVTSIKFQFKHRNLQMSEYYANNAVLKRMEDVLLDSELLDLFDEESVQVGVDIFDDIYNQSEHLSGTEGKRIAQQKLEKLSAGHQVFMDRSELEMLVRNGSLSVVRLPTGGYCLNSKCNRVCSVGEFAAEVKPCEYQVMTDKEARKVLRANKRLIIKFKRLNTGDSLMQTILIALKQKIKLNERVLDKHGFEYESFDDVVEV